MKTCSKCHIEKEESEFSKRYGKPRSECKVCSFLITKDWRIRNKEKEAKKKREWRINNKERVREHKKQSDSRNRVKCNERAKRWRENNIEKNREKNNKWRNGNIEKARELSRNAHKIAYKRNPELFRQRTKEWVKNNMDKVREMDRRGTLTLRNKYVTQLLRHAGYSLEQIKQHPELFELKKLSVIISRSKKLLNIK